MFFKAIMPFLAVVFALPVAPAGEGETRTPEVGTDGALSPVTWPGKREFESVVKRSNPPDEHGEGDNPNFQSTLSSSPAKRASSQAAQKVSMESTPRASTEKLMDTPKQTPFAHGDGLSEWTKASPRQSTSNRRLRPWVIYSLAVSAIANVVLATTAYRAVTGRHSDNNRPR
ncbi:hypothetical protein DL546_002708 [Coniochaeta pulveracea]|uniref:Uncharacterized protein n=1 Tax=Coniochaeta pulveracea TaxID=177199 RepID=A0A420XZP5_9PEZI|nr:hypothetical protein DL546_002708 [Coniochaeta pulveracea]